MTMMIPSFAVKGKLRQWAWPGRFIVEMREKLQMEGMKMESKLALCDNYKVS